MVWSRDEAISQIRSRAGSHSIHRCAFYTRGLSRGSAGSTVIAGDVAIIQPYAGGNPSGHMTMYDGTTWYLDFRQNSMYPGGGYRAAQPAYKIFRKN